MSVLVNIPITLDLSAEVTDNPRIIGTVGDADTICLNVTLTNNGEKINLEEWGVMFKAALPDNQHYIQDRGDVYGNLTVISTSDGRFDYVFVKEAFSVPGIIKNACFALFKEDVTLQSDQDIKHTRNFQYEAKQDPLQGKIEASQFSSDILKFEQDIQDIRNDITANQADMQRLQDTQAVIETEQQALREEIGEAGTVKTGDTTNWQKYVLTNEEGVAKSIPTGQTVLADFVEAGIYYVNSTQAKALTDIPIATAFRLENRRLIKGTVAEQTIRYFNSVNGELCREFHRYGGSTWLEVETALGAQEKADKAEQNAINYILSLNSSVDLYKGTGIYLSDTQSYTWNHDEMNEGLFFEVIRYQPGSGSLGYGKYETHYTKEFIENSLNIACWLPMIGSNGEKKAMKFTITNGIGTITGYASNSASPDNTFAFTRIRSK